MVVDASVWVSRFLPQDAFYETSRTWLINSTAAGTSLIAPAIALAELSGSIARRTGNTQLGYQIAQQIQQLPTLQLISIDNELGLLAAKIASEYQLHGADSIHVAVAYQLDMPLISWDKEQLDRAKALVPTHQPS
jgi:predicted nucleic acid-binding protein